MSSRPRSGVTPRAIPEISGQDRNSISRPEKKILLPPGRWGGDRRLAVVSKLERWTRCTVSRERHSSFSLLYRTEPTWAREDHSAHQTMLSPLVNTFENSVVEVENRARRGDGTQTHPGDLLRQFRPGDQTPRERMFRSISMSRRMHRHEIRHVRRLTLVHQNSTSWFPCSLAAN